MSSTGRLRPAPQHTHTTTPLSPPHNTALHCLAARLPDPQGTEEDGHGATGAKDAWAIKYRRENYQQSTR